MRPLRELLDPDERLVALVGAGGKTALMRALARQLAGWGERVLLVASQGSRLPGRNVLLTARGEVPKAYTLLTLARDVDPDTGLALALRPEDIPAVAERLGARRVLVELGASGGLPLACGPVPALPAGIDAVVAVLGLDALGMPAREASADPRPLRALAGLAPGDAVDAPALEAVAASLLAGAPGGARRLVFFNKAEAHALPAAALGAAPGAAPERPPGAAPGAASGAASGAAPEPGAERVAGSALRGWFLSLGGV